MKRQTFSTSLQPYFINIRIHFKDKWNLANPCKNANRELVRVCGRVTVDTWQFLPSVNSVLRELERQFRNSHMEHKLKKPLVYNFNTSDPQIAHLTFTSEALIMNTSALIGIQRGQTLDKVKRVLYVIYWKRRFPDILTCLSAAFNPFWRQNQITQCISSLQSGSLICNPLY